MRKIKLLYGLEASGGGALKHLIYLATRLDRKVFDITVILSDSRKENITEEIKDIEGSGAKVLVFPMCRTINPMKDIKALFRLISFLKQEKFDIVHAHSSKAGGIFRLAAWLCKVPSIYYTPHCFYFQGKEGIKKKLYILLEKLLSKITTKIIVSEGEQKQAMHSNLTKASKIININNAIDFDEYRQTNETVKTKMDLGIPVNAFIVGAIGRLTLQKDWETYIYSANEVLKKYPEVKFLIVGDGEQYNEIRKLIFKLDLEEKIILSGYFKEIHKIYGVIDIYVNTSLWEGLPYVFLEAMKYKKPIIATDTGNDSTILRGECGYISPVKDYHSISAKIIKLIENKQLATQMGENGNDWLIRKYSFELFIKQHELTYMNNLNLTSM